MSSAAPTHASPLFEAQALRVAIDGAVALEQTDLLSVGHRVALVGDVAPLMALLTNVPLGATSAELALEAGGDATGVATVASGALRILGADAGRGEHLARAGVAPHDPPLATDLTCEAYVGWSARLGGMGRAALDRARESLERVGLGKSRKRTIASLARAEKRALVIAGALATSPELLVADMPLSGLEGSEAAFVLAALNAASEGRASIVSLARMSPASPEASIAAGASDVAYFSRGELVLSGRPTSLAAGARLFGLTVRCNAEALRDELVSRGIELTGGPLRFAAHVPEGRDTRDILAAAAAARAAVVELLALM